MSAIIDELVALIRGARYGREVRESIAHGIEVVDDVAEGARDSATTSASEAHGYANNAQQSANDAHTHAVSASSSADTSEDYSKLSHSWAEGNTGVRPDENTHNAKYWAESVRRGEPNGIASLDGNGRVPYSQLPESAMEFKGTWNASTNTPTLVSGQGTNGDFYIVSVGGTWNNISFNANDRIIFDGVTAHDWVKLVAGEVNSVNGQSGQVQLNADNIPFDGTGTDITSTDVDGAIKEAYSHGGGGQYFYEYEITTASTEPSTASFEVTKRKNGLLVSVRTYAWQDITTPVNVDGVMTVQYDSVNTYKFIYTLLTDSTTHDTGYSYAWSYLDTVDVAETFTQSAIYAVDIAPEFSESQTYQVGDYVTYNGATYMFTSTKAVGTWDSTKVNALYSMGVYVTAGKKANTTLGEYATAEGHDTKASGDYSHAEGSYTDASALGSHAEGGRASGTIYPYWQDHTTASGEVSHAEGEVTFARGKASHSEGAFTQANGSYSHAEGNNTEATGSCSHAEGDNTEANGVCSHAEGNGTQTGADYQHVQGKYNIGKTTTLFEIGNGTSSSARSNAFEVDTNGNVVAGGTITDGQGRVLGSGGHVIKDETGTSVTQRENLQFVGLNVDDDGTNTVVSDPVFTGTTAEWTAVMDKSMYKIVNLTDDGETGEVVDAVTDGDMRPVTSNAVADLLSVDGVSKSNNAISANDVSTIVIDVSKANKTPLGIVGIVTSGSSYDVVSNFYISGNNANIRIKNTSSASINVTVSVRVLYKSV